MHICPNSSGRSSDGRGRSSQRIGVAPCPAAARYKMNKEAELRKGIEEFNRGDYFECHETLEEVWMVEVGEDKRFYQGLIQLSVGCFHLLNSNLRGAASQWEKGITKLTDYGDEHLGVDLKMLLGQMHRCQQMLEMVRCGGQQRFDSSLVPRIIICD